MTGLFRCWISGPLRFRNSAGSCGLFLFLLAMSLIAGSVASGQAPVRQTTDDISKQQPPPPKPPPQAVPGAAMATPQTAQVRADANAVTGDMTMGLAQIRQRILTDMDQLDAANAATAARDKDLESVRGCFAIAGEAAIRGCVAAAVPALANVSQAPAPPAKGK
jgi:hypothetical protein